MLAPAVLPNWPEKVWTLVIGKPNHYILKTEAIIEELNYSLDMEKGGEIAKNLRSLYDFIMERLLTANVKIQRNPR